MLGYIILSIFFLVVSFEERVLSYIENIENAVKKSDAKIDKIETVLVDVVSRVETIEEGIREVGSALADYKKEIIEPGFLADSDLKSISQIKECETKLMSDEKYKHNMVWFLLIFI